MKAMKEKRAKENVEKVGFSRSVMLSNLVCAIFDIILKNR